MKITICGSMFHEPHMATLESELRSRGYDTERPNIAEGHAYGDDLDASAALKRGFINKHFAKIDTSDAILVVNDSKNGIDNYVGGNTLIEIAYAYSQGLEIFLLNPVPDISYRDEINGMAPIVLHGDLEKLDEYIKNLPVLMVSSESQVKHRALSRGLRAAGIRTQIVGYKVDSGVNEQPTSVEESYTGALNRHANMKKTHSSETASYFATIESGYHTIHPRHNAFGCAVIVIEKNGGEQKIGIDVDVEFPRSMTDKIPSEYADMGILVQQEYGSKLKDPYPFFTNGKLTRAKVLENAIYNVAVQFS